MKKSNQLSSFLLLCLFIFSGSNRIHAQLDWVKASNKPCYYQTTPGAYFTWSGECKNSYCDGYGTIQWYQNGRYSSKYTGYVRNGKNNGYGVLYNSNGNKAYDGYWQNDMRNGYGTSYNEYGYINYQGYFEDDDWKHADEVDVVAKSLANYMVNDFFIGGDNARYSIVKCLYDRNDDLTEIRVRITFNGIFISSNYYAFTMVVKDTAPYLEFVDCNELARNYINVVGFVTILDAIDRIFRSASY